MRSYIIIFFLFLYQISSSQSLITKFEKSNGTETPTYSEIIDWWKRADAVSPEIKMMEMGPSDAGFPLHLVMIAADKDFSISSIKAKHKSILFINNGIHPGEPDGIDACMLLAKEIIEKKYKLPSNLVLAIIPVYNIGGCLNRSDKYRVDQNGPKEFGFRGNSENLDLNRDFIKCDSKEALTFSHIFHYLDPEVFVDNHVSDGADYQHVMTLLSSQHDKLGGEMGKFLNGTFEPALYQLMKGKGFDLVPYVNHSGETPDNGWSAYWDSPRYSTGYATLWNTFGFMPETHMLKPYKQRVESTKALMESFIEFISSHNNEIQSLRHQTIQQSFTKNQFAIAWKLDRSQSYPINYKGYQARYKSSDVSGLNRLYYDRTKPFEKQVPFYNTFVDTLQVTKPLAYIIPQGWWKVLDRLKANNVVMRKINSDTTIEVEWYRIENYQSLGRPYEGHHLNSRTRISKNTKKVQFRKGDYYIPMDQKANRFLMETLEPQGEDSYFAWNFFDPILGQKEGYSDYHFEDIAATYLKGHPHVQNELEERRKTDSAFRSNADAQLNFIYQHSEWIEPAYLQYPVYRVVNP
jgi:hypothetical protein